MRLLLLLLPQVLDDKGTSLSMDVAHVLALTSRVTKVMEDPGHERWQGMLDQLTAAVKK